MKQKNQPKRLLALTLALLAALPLYACSDAVDDGASDTTVTDADTTSAETAALDPSEILELPDADYNGADFIIANVDWELFNNNVIADAESGDTINDAVYERTILTEEKANVNLKSFKIGDSMTKLNTAIQTAVMAGDDPWQLALVHCIYGVASVASQGLVENWNDVPHVDFTKKWWKSSANENLSINGIQTHVVSEFIRSDPVALLFNIEMVENYSLESPYDLVNAGTWTWNKLIEMSGVVSADIDGDGQMTDVDQYGYIGSLDWQTLSIAPSCGQLMLEVNSDGEPEIVFNNEKMYSIMEMLYKLYYDGKNRAYTWPYTTETDPNHGGKPPVDFGAGKALFYQLPLTSLPSFRATELEFGVLPFPKYDEEQENYLSLDWSGFMCIPRMTNPDSLDMIGYVSELLSYYSLDTTVPAWYDILLTDKIARDDNSIKMLDIIYSNLVYDPGLNYCEGYTKLYYGPYYVLEDKSSDFASYYEANISQAEQHYTKIYDAILENYSK